MTELINHLDPEILIGYNILSFDYPYLDEESKGDYKNGGRVVAFPIKPCAMTSKTWRSGAYGHNSINILQMDRWISLDMLPLIKRDYKLDKYDLDTTSKEFLGAHRGKHDVKADVQSEFTRSLSMQRMTSHLS